MSKSAEKFCANPACCLHVAWVDGHNWAELPDGRVYGRAFRDSQYYCDICLHHPEQPVSFDPPEYE